MDTKSNKTKNVNVMGTGKYLNPKADLTFKLVFGEHEDLMMSLLNALLPIAEETPITHVEYLSPEMVPEIVGKKDSIVDVRCRDSAGRQFIVEMQMHWNEDFMKRVLLNASKSIVKQAGMGEKYRQIQPVFSLNLINDSRFQPDTEEFYHDYAVINVEHPEKTIDGLRFVFVELPKFQPKSIAEKKMAVLWLRFLTEIGEDTKVAPKELLENEQTRKALEIIEKSAMSEAQIYAY
jgi:predicted transposase/invertase (TIGR01784 family)